MTVPSWLIVTTMPGRTVAFAIWAAVIFGLFVIAQEAYDQWRM